MDMELDEVFASLLNEKEEERKLEVRPPTNDHVANPSGTGSSTSSTDRKSTRLNSSHAD